MSGCGRTHRAKHVERQFLDDEWEGLDSKRGDRLAVVLEAPQGKSVRVNWVADILLAEKDETTAPTASTSSSSSSSPSATAHHSLPQTSASGQIIAPPTASSPAQEKEEKKPVEVQYITIPGKFFRVIWLGKGDVIVVRDGLMDRKLTEGHLRAFLDRKESTAPPHPVELTSLLEQIRFILFVSEAEKAKGNATVAQLAEKGGDKEERTGEEEEEEEEEEDDIMVNSNRRGRDTQYVSSGRYRTAAAQEEDEEEEEEEGE